MNSPDAALAARPDACSACGGALDALGQCEGCGAVFGEAFRCPLCEAVSGIEPNEALRFCCRTCGGPRIPPNVSPISEPERALLRTARADQLRAGAFRAGAAFASASGLLSVLVTLVVLLATTPSPVAKFAAWLATSVPFALAWFALARSRRYLKQQNSALERAWFLAASRLAEAAGGTMTVPALAQALRIDGDRAELLLAELSLEQNDPFDTASPRLRVGEPSGAESASELTESTRATRDASKS